MPHLEAVTGNGWHRGDPPEEGAPPPTPLRPPRGHSLGAAPAHGQPRGLRVRPHRGAASAPGSRIRSRRDQGPPWRKRRKNHRPALSSSPSPPLPPWQPWEALGLCPHRAPGALPPRSGPAGVLAPSLQSLRTRVTVSVNHGHPPCGTPAGLTDSLPQVTWGQTGGQRARGPAAAGQG